MLHNECIMNSCECMVDVEYKMVAANDSLLDFSLQLSFFHSATIMKVS